MAEKDRKMFFDEKKQLFKCMPSQHRNCGFHLTKYLKNNGALPAMQERSI